MKLNKLFLTLFALAIVAILLEVEPVRAINPPVAENDFYTTLLNENLSVDAPGVLENDHDPEGDPLTAILVDDSQASGILFLFSDGSFEYEPAPDFVGVDLFTYVANDGGADSNEATIEFMVSGLDVTVYTDQDLYLADLAAMALTPLHEGFEDDAFWGDVRTTIVGGAFTAPSIKSLGITWTANNETSEITTGPGPARRGEWGFFSLPHGSYTTGTNCHIPVNCGDGWHGTTDMPLAAIGGWVETNTPYADLLMYLEGNTDAPIHFGDAFLDNQYKFFGVIAPSGFTQFEFRETEGVSEDAKYIFSDDFYFAYVNHQTLQSRRLQLRLSQQQSRISARIAVVDQDRNPAEGAAVAVQWILPDESVIPMSRSTNAFGRASWQIPYAGPGEYRLEVLDIDKTGHAYIGGATSRSITVP